MHLDDAVVVGGGEGEDFGDTHAGELFCGGTSKFCRVVHGPDPDDGSLAFHEARDGVDGSDGAGVRQGDGDTLKSVMSSLPWRARRTTSS